MSVTTGVDVEQLDQAVEAITEETTVGQFRFRANTEWIDALKSVTTIDDLDQADDRIHTQEFTVEGDEPEQILRNRTAPNVAERLRAALRSCLSVGYAANATAMGIELDSLRFELEGDVGLRGFLGIFPDVRAGYSSMTCTAYIDAGTSEEELAELRHRVETASPLMDSITNAVPLETDMVSEQGECRGHTPTLVTTKRGAMTVLRTLQRPRLKRSP